MTGVHGRVLRLGACLLAAGVVAPAAAQQGDGSDTEMLAPVFTPNRLPVADGGSGVPLAGDRPETQAPGVLALRSPSFEEGGTIPPRHSAYHAGTSPALQWAPVPGAQSYAIVMEDPDARPVTPFVHWVAWNIRPEITSLSEGLQPQMRLDEPAGLMQGASSRGVPGYFGPRPPVGDPPHRYVFQVFALDTLLMLPPGADRDALLRAAQGHVIAKGRLTGRYQQTQAPLE